MHNSLQPIYKLPDEVLTHIFEVGVPAPAEQWSHDPRENPATQWTLEQYQKMLWSVAAVCGRFRVALLNSPHCWTWVSYLFDTRSSRGESRRFEALETVLTRSKGVPFNFYLEIKTRQQRLTTPPFEVLSRTVLPHMHRCKWFYFKCDYCEVNLPIDIFTNVTTPMRSLRDIEIFWYDWYIIPGEGEFEEEALQSISSLTTGVDPEVPLLSFTITSNFIQNINFTLVEPKYFTRLRIDAPCRAEDAVAFLSLCDSLEHLQWHWTPDHVDGTNSIQTPPRTLSLRNLISLQVNYTLPTGIALNAPRLEQLKVVDGGSQDPNGGSIDILHPEHPAFPSLHRASLPGDLSNDN